MESRYVFSMKFLGPVFAKQVSSGIIEKVFEKGLSRGR